MKSDHVKFKRQKDEDFLIVDQLVFDNVSPYALKVYGQLRKLTSYTSQDDETEITVKNLAKASGISERKTYDCLNELEYTHYIIQRINVYHIRWGQINTFNVSQTYGRYRPAVPSVPPAPKTQPVDNFDQKLTPPAQYAEGTAQYADLNKQESFQEVFKKKQNKETVKKTPVSVFSDKQTVKNHIELTIASRQTFVEDETIEQGIYYAYETNKDKSFDSVNKRINIFLKKVREGNWLIPQNYKGISSHSIREKEEKELESKRMQWQEEAHAAKNIFAAVTQGQGFKSFGEMFQKLKDDVHGKDINNRGMQKEAV